MSRLKLFEGFGIELEYMIVDKDSLDVRSVADELIKKVTGKYTNEVNNSLIDWSNELVTHVIELKNNKPEAIILELAPLFQLEVKRINKILDPLGAMLMPGACHPWMNPEVDTKIWPHENNVIYDTYNRLFGCKGHGWSNLQSMHINISFATDEEFAKLHTAIRSILPLVPALSSSSPVIDGRLGGAKSHRLEHYLKNQKKVPSIMGLCIPDAPQSEAQYKAEILEPMYRDVAVLDTESVLQEEWLNSRGAIPKFEKGCIEIRLADLNESPMVDCSIAWFWTELIKALCAGEIGDLDALRAIPTADLRQILDETVWKAEDGRIPGDDYVKAFGLYGQCTAKDFLSHLVQKVKTLREVKVPALDDLMRMGTLSHRITEALDGDDSKDNIRAVYRKLAACLDRGDIFKTR